MVNTLKEFGIAGLFGTMIIVGTFIILGILVARDKVDPIVLLPTLSGWVSSIVTAYFVVKGVKSGKEQ